MKKRSVFGLMSRSEAWRPGGHPRAGGGAPLRGLTGMPAAGLCVLLFASVASAQTLARYALMLADPPVAKLVRRGDRVAAAAAHPRLRTSPDSLKDELRARNFRVTGETDTLLNAIFVAADRSDESQLRTISGVRAVLRLPRVHRNLDAAEQVINVPAAWNLLGGTSNAGAGIKIGIEMAWPIGRNTAPC